jgi:hypothetical protein
VLTDKDADDSSRVGPLLDRIDGPVVSFTGGGAFDRDEVYAEVTARHPDAAVIMPPRAIAVPSATSEIAPAQRDLHLRRTAGDRGRHRHWRTEPYA